MLFQVKAVTDDEKRRHEHALLRRQARLQTRASESRIPLDWNCFDDGHATTQAMVMSNSVRVAKETIAHTTQVVLPGNANTVGGNWISQTKFK